MKFPRSSLRELLAIAVAGVGLLFLVFGGKMRHPKTAGNTDAPDVSTPSSTVDPTLTEMENGAGDALPTDLPGDPNHPPAVDLKLSPNATDTERQIAAANDPRLTPSQRARALFALLPTLPEDALDEAVQRAVEGLPDADYGAVALPVVINPETHGRLLSVLFADLMERPDSITLPALLSIARNPMHPFATAAQDNLRFLAGEDLGSNWPRWEERIRSMLATGKRQ